MIRRFSRSHTALALSVLFLMPWSTGCSEDDSPTVVLTPPDDSLPLVSDADVGRDQLVANLGSAYAQMNYGIYENLINVDFVFRFDPGDVRIVGVQELSAVKDLESTFAMFDGETGLEPVLDFNGNLTGENGIVPPVKSIRLNLTPVSASSWTFVNDGVFKGTWRRVYDVDITLNYIGVTRVDQITGKQIFYLIAATISVDDESFDVWQLRAWEDQSLGANPAPPGSGSAAARRSGALATEPISIGQLKAWF